MNIKEIIPLIGLLLTASCSEGLLVQQDSDVIDPSQITHSNTYFVNTEEAVGYANCMRSQIAPQTRSTTVKDIQVIRNAKTRGSLDTELPDTLLYIVNYTNDEGFALVSADKRFEAIYAISDEGCLNVSDFEENPGLSLFLENVIEDMHNHLPTTRDFIVNWPTHQDRYAQYGPHLTKKQRSWTQSAPFNNLVGNGLPTGCVPVAVGTIMSYYSWPLSYNGTTYDWSQINDPDAIPYSAAYLIRDLRNSSNLQMDLKDNQTWYWKVKPTLEHMGYIVPYDFVPLNAISLRDALKTKPVLVRGEGKEYVEPEWPDDEDWDGSFDFGEPAGGHMWVMDGFLQKYKYQNGMYALDPYGMTYYHCVWGWGNSLANGYFAWGYDSGFGPMPDFLDEDDPHNDRENKWHFYHDLRFMRGMYPDK